MQWGREVGGGVRVQEGQAEASHYRSQQWAVGAQAGDFEQVGTRQLRCRSGYDDGNGKDRWGEKVVSHSNKEKQ